MQEEEAAGFVPVVGNLWLAAHTHTHTLFHLTFVSSFFSSWMFSFALVFIFN